MSDVISREILETLKNVVKESIENFEVTLHDGNKKGEGFLGKIIFVSLRNKKHDQEFHFIVKQAFTNRSVREMHPIRSVYINEIYFYSQIWPQLNKFQERIDPKYQFQKLPKCFAAVDEENSEKLLLENLKFHNFEIYDKRKPFNKEHVELIFKEYGKLHALSFAYKSLYPKSYVRLVEGTTNTFSDIGSRDYFQKGNVATHEACLNNLLPGMDDAVIEKYKHYPKICNKLFFESINCDTKYTVIIHGDCWSNNMMFKYNEARQVTDIRFLDFQMSKEGSPCCDLSYCLYSGASKEILKDLNYYLQLYHDSLSETLRQFGCDLRLLYPLQELKNDWKRFCKLGFTLALMLWKLKLTHDGEFKDLEDFVKLSEEEFNSSAYDEETYKKVTRDLILHLYENDYL